MALNVETSNIQRQLEVINFALNTYPTIPKLAKAHFAQKLAEAGWNISENQDHHLVFLSGLDDRHQVVVSNNIRSSSLEITEISPEPSSKRNTMNDYYLRSETPFDWVYYSQNSRPKDISEFINSPQSVQDTLTHSLNTIESILVNTLLVPDNT